MMGWVADMYKLKTLVCVPVVQVKELEQVADVSFFSR